MPRSYRMLITRGGSNAPVYATRDVFDSTIEIYDSDGKLVFFDPNANTDYCYGYTGGILAEGKFSGVWGTRLDNNKKALFIGRHGSIKTLADWGGRNIELTSLVPNKNHNWKTIIKSVLWHGDNRIGGGSHGCQTSLPDHWRRACDLFHDGDQFDIELVRNPAWKAPKQYQEG